MQKYKEKPITQIFYIFFLSKIEADTDKQRYHIKIYHISNRKGETGNR